MSDRAKLTNKPGVLSGVFIGAIVTIALLAVFYAGWKAAGLSFVPYDVFDWMTRNLPGSIIEFVIGTMVTIIRFLNFGPTSVIAKQTEQAIGIVNLFLTGLIGGGVLFLFLNTAGKNLAYLFGIVLGIIIGVPAAVISLTTGKTATTTPIFNAIWIILMFLLWGIILGWAYRRMPVAKKEPADAGAIDIAGPTKIERISRRRFLIKLAGSTAVITVSGATVGVLGNRIRGSGAGQSAERWSATHSLPNQDAAVMPAPGTRPEYTSLEDHYRIDINAFPPMIDENAWRLEIKGLVNSPLNLTLDDLRQYEPIHQFITLSCISNPVGGDLIGTTRWTGVSLQRLLPDWGVKPEATHLLIRSADDFFESVSLEAIRSEPRIMLVYEWDGVPLSNDHGFPLRIYIPDVHGMKQPKWIESIELIDHLEPGYWVVRGWDQTARMKATSVIDTIAVEELSKSNGQTLIPVGGIAHAGARGISKVEIKIDDGPWNTAELRTPLSGLTWVIWRYNWPFQSGEHSFTVRCYDGQGTPQIVQPASPYPSGASGLYSESKEIS